MFPPMDANSNRAIGATLKELRLEHGLTQVELAAALNRPQSFIAKLESGERSLHVNELFAYADALGFPASEVLSRLECLRK